MRGRPRRTPLGSQTKSMRLPRELIEQIESSRKKGENFTAALIRLVEKGLLG